MTCKEFVGERVPQHIQNLVIRNYCVQNNYQYLLSVVEYTMNDTYLILKQVVNDLNNIDGIGFYSMFQLPHDNTKRLQFLNTVIKKKKFIFFCSEGFQVKNKLDIDKINTIWLIKNLKHSLKNFTHFKNKN